MDLGTYSMRSLSGIMNYTYSWELVAFTKNKQKYVWYNFLDTKSTTYLLNAKSLDVYLLKTLKFTYIWNTDIYFSADSKYAILVSLR